MASSIPVKAAQQNRNLGEGGGVEGDQELISQEAADIGNRVQTSEMTRETTIRVDRDRASRILKEKKRPWSV
jgi:hypothetical protein